MSRSIFYSMSFRKVLVYFFKRMLLLAAKLAGLKGFCLCIALALFLGGKLSGTMLVSVMGLVLCNAGGQHIAESLNSRNENSEEVEEDTEKAI